MSCKSFVTAVAVVITIVYAQQDPSPECPPPWISEGNNCYLFSSSTDLLPWLDAKIACEKFGAQLISINSVVEHNLVQNYFMQYDNIPGLQNRWYTGAYPETGTSGRTITWRWLDGTAFGSTVFWVNEFQPQVGLGDHVVYFYNDKDLQKEQPGYFWFRDTGALPYRYICETPKTESGRILTKDRDFAFGADNVHPDELPRGPYFLSQPYDQFYQISVDVTSDCTGTCRSVSFDCEAKGFPQPTYVWYQDTLAGTSVVSPITNNKITITNGRLTVTDPNRATETAAYWCEASNIFGRIRSAKGRIVYIMLDEFPKNTKDTNAKQFDSAVIVCDHDKREGIRYSYSWYKNADPTNFVLSTYNNHLMVSESGNLYFSAVYAADAADYYCSVSVEGGDETRSSPRYPLKIDLSQSYKPIGPIIHNDFPRVIPSNPTKGAKVVLECLARFARREGIPAFYSWRRANAQPLPVGSIQQDFNRKLIIPNVKPEDRGVYICTCEYQTSSDSKNVTLSISAAPYFGQGALDDQHKDQGSSFSWACLAGGDPLPTYTWFKNGRLLNVSTVPFNTNNRVTFSSDNRVITFRQLNKDYDQGMYQCAASNTLGTVYSNGQLRILQFSPRFVKHPMLGEVVATEGGNATIPCDPEAAPQAKISWLFNGAAISYDVADGKSAKRLLPNSYIFLRQVQKSSDEGIYTCVAENNVANATESRANASIKLTVVQRSRLLFGPLDMSVRLGSEVQLQCRADFNPFLDLVYLWYHNGRLLDLNTDWRIAQIYKRGEGVNRGDLIIRNVSYEERGQFQCTVYTKSDRAFLSAIIIVYGPPGEPAGVEASVGGHSVLLSWVAGAEHGKPITAYLIEKYNIDTQKWVLAKNVTNPEEVARCNSTVDGLFANTQYKFRVFGVNEYGVGDPSVESDLKTTAPDKPTSYPTNIRGGGGKEGTLVIEWDPLPKEEWNAPDVFYIVQYRQADGNVGGQGGWSNCTDKGKPISHGSPKTGKCVVTLGEEYFFMKYTIRVWVYNRVGVGPIPDPVTAMSAVKVPTQTPKRTIVQPLNSTALSVFWDAIPDDRSITGGELLGFHIQYWLSGTTSEFGRRNTIFGNVTEGTIIGLQANTEYSVAVQLFNSAGDGTPGREIKQTTWMKAPQNMPEYVTLNKTDDNIVNVHFRGVVTGTTEEPLDGYKVRIWRQGESLRATKDYDCGRHTWISIKENFEKNALYNLRVFAYSRGGVGKMSSPLIQFTIGCNRRPTNPEALWISLCDGCSYATISTVLVTFISLLHLFLF